jgi:hypothetical protein
LYPPFHHRDGEIAPGLCRFYNLRNQDPLQSSQSTVTLTVICQAMAAFLPTPRAQPGTVQATNPTFCRFKYQAWFPQLNFFISSHPDYLVLLHCSPSCRPTHTSICTECSVPKLTRWVSTPVCRAHLTKFIQARHNGPRNCYPPYQSDAVENVYYWYDGYMPYCTDSTVWQPLDDNFHLNLSGYSSVDKFQGTPHQVNGIT